MHIQQKSPTKAFAKVLALALLAAAIAFLAVVIKLGVELYSDPMSSYPYELVSSFISSEEPLVSIAEDGKVAKISVTPEARLIITFIVGFFGLSVIISVISGLVSSAINLLNFSDSYESAT